VTRFIDHLDEVVDDIGLDVGERPGDISIEPDDDPW
jgi:hypothetical protein